MSTPLPVVPEGISYAGPNDLTETEQNMQNAGVAATASVQQDYFGFGSLKQWMFPDGVSYLTLKAMNEGDRTRFQEQTSKNVRIFKGSGDASMRLNPAEDRRVLLEIGIVGWNLTWVSPTNPTAGRQPRQFTAGTLAEFIRTADPTLIDNVVDSIRELNPWMKDELTVEAIDEEIENLKTQRQELVARQEAKSALR